MVAWLKEKLSNTSPLTPRTFLYPSSCDQSFSLLFSAVFPERGSTNRLTTPRTAQNSTENGLEKIAPNTNPRGALALNRQRTIFFSHPWRICSAEKSLTTWDEKRRPHSKPRMTQKNTVPFPPDLSTCRRNLAGKLHIANQIHPATNTFLCPNKSPTLPDGRTKVADVSP